MPARYVILYYLFACVSMLWRGHCIHFLGLPQQAGGLKQPMYAISQLRRLEVCNQGVRLAGSLLEALKENPFPALLLAWWVVHHSWCLLACGQITPISPLAFRLPSFPVSLSSPFCSLIKTPLIGSGPILNPGGCLLEILWLIISVKMLFSDQVTFWGSGWIWMFEGPYSTHNTHP